jgi:hypothetical protein
LVSLQTLPAILTRGDLPIFLPKRKTAAKSREWLKTRCSAVGKFVITGFRDITSGQIEAITVAEVVDDKLMPVGEVQFGVGRGLRKVEAIRLDRGREGAECRCGRCWAPRSSSSAGHRAGAIRDGVVRAVAPLV